MVSEHDRQPEMDRAGDARGVSRSVAALLAGGVAGKICRFAGMILVANALGAAAFGTLAAVLGVVFPLVYLSDFGLSLLGTRELAAGPAERPKLVVNILLLKALFMTFAVAALLAVPRLLGLPPDVTILAAASVALVLTHETVFEWVFEGSGKTTLFGLYRAVLNGLFLAAVVFLVKAPADATLVPLVDAGASLLGLVACLAVWPGVWRYASGRLDFSIWRRLIRAAAPLGVANVLDLATPHIGVLVLIALAGPNEAGLFRAAGILVFGLVSVGFLISRAAYPLMSRVGRDSPEELAGILAPIVRLLFAISVPAAVGIAIIARPLTAVLFEPEYAPAARVLAIMACSLPIALAGIACHYALIACGGERRRLWGIALNVAIEAGLAVALVPGFSCVGAASAHLCGRAVSFVYVWWSLQRMARVPILRHALRPAAACAVLAAVVFPLRGHNVVLPVLVGAAAYLIALLIVGGISVREIASVWRLVFSRTRE